jgi:hypothetical protein
VPDARHPKTAGRGVERGAGADHAAADDHEVERLRAQPLPGLFPFGGAQPTAADVR